MTNSLPQRASALKSEARRTLLANRDQIRLAEQNDQVPVLASYTNQRADLIREAASVLSPTELSDLTGLTRQRIHQILSPAHPTVRGADNAQAEYELAEAVRQYRTDRNTQTLAILETVVANIRRADALPLSTICTMTGWFSDWVQFLTHKNALSSEQIAEAQKWQPRPDKNSPGPVAAQLPETDV